MGPGVPKTPQTVVTLCSRGEAFSRESGGLHGSNAYTHTTPPTFLLAHAFQCRLQIKRNFP